MPQTPEGALKITAKLAGLSVEEYKNLLNKGLRRCTRCKTWKLRELFGNDRSRPDGINRTCITCKRVEERKCTKGRVSTFKGKKHKPESLKKMSDANKGHKRRLGIKHTPETRAKISKIVRQNTQRGQDHYAWKGGVKQRNLSERRSPEYEQWRFAVYKRDEFTCQHCGDDTGGNLHAHHIKPFADYPELRLELLNGITLCKLCHEAEHAKDRPPSKRRPQKSTPVSASEKLAGIPAI